MAQLDKELKKAKQALQLFEKLQKVRNMDFPKNPEFLYLLNYNILVDYFNNKMCKFEYKFKTDYYQRLFVYNFVASIKSYLNRKQKTINAIVPQNYKYDINNIYQKYWKSKRTETALDYLVSIRDIFEHEKIDNLRFETIIWQDHIDFYFKYKNFDLLQIGEKAIKEIKLMNNEIEKYVEIELSKLNLRHNCLFINAFNKQYNKNDNLNIFPEPTQEEIDYYDKLIQKLSCSN